MSNDPGCTQSLCLRLYSDSSAPGDEVGDEVRVELRVVFPEQVASVSTGTTRDLSPRTTSSTPSESIATSDVRSSPISDAVSPAPAPALTRMFAFARRDGVDWPSAQLRSDTNSWSLYGRAGSAEASGFNRRGVAVRGSSASDIRRSWDRMFPRVADLNPVQPLVMKSPMVSLRNSAPRRSGSPATLVAQTASREQVSIKSRSSYGVLARHSTTAATTKSSTLNQTSARNRG
jgi:hypothetical protein